MSKYLAVFKISWENMLVYRLNFFLWRVRSVLQLLLVYFVWWTVFQKNQQVFGYTEASILTYILISAIIRAIVLSSRVSDLAGQINDGSFANFLTKPFGIITYFFTRDLADKLLNISFVVVEIAALIFLLKPNLIIQQNYLIILFFLLATILGILLYFMISLIVSLLAFWLENTVWGPQFLMVIFLEGLGGGLFPIDILPGYFAQVLLLTPFPYLIYFPSKLYLGGMTGTEILQGFIILIFWVMFSWVFMMKILRIGFKYYTAQGH